MALRVLGLRYEYDSLFDKIIISARDDNNIPIEISLCEKLLTLEVKMNAKNGHTWVPKENIRIPVFSHCDEIIQNNVFFYEKDKLLKINLDLFKKTIRHKSKRPVWIIESSEMTFSVKNLNVYSLENLSADDLESKILQNFILASDVSEENINKIKSQCANDNNNEYIKISFDGHNGCHNSKHIIKWIFSGNSNIGKSYVSHKLGLKIYETDCSDKLDDNIENYDVIVVGNKYNCDIQQIIDKLNRYHTVITKFEKI